MGKLYHIRHSLMDYKCNLLDARKSGLKSLSVGFWPSRLSPSTTTTTCSSCLVETHYVKQIVALPLEVPVTASHPRWSTVRALSSRGTARFANGRACLTRVVYIVLVCRLVERLSYGAELSESRPAMPSPLNVSSERWIISGYDAVDILCNASPQSSSMMHFYIPMEARFCVCIHAVSLSVARQLLRFLPHLAVEMDHFLF